MPPTITKTISKPKLNSTMKSSTTTKTGSVISRIKPIGFDDGQGIKAMLYGKSGTGKTTLWGSFPAPILSIVCSAGNYSGELRSLNTPANKNRISQATLNDSKELVELAEYASQGNFATVVLDHVTGLQDLVLKEILGLDKIPEQKSWGMAAQQDYGACAIQCKTLLRHLLDLSINVVFIGQERAFNEESSSELIQPTIGVGVTPSLAGWLNTAVDYICQTFIRQKETIEVQTVGVGKMAKKVTIKTPVEGEVEYCLRTSPSPLYMTKFRMPKERVTARPDIVDPDYDKIMLAINGDAE